MAKIDRKRKRQGNNQKNIRNKSTDKEQDIQPAAAAPYVVVVHGPPKVGKTLLIKALVKHYTNHNLITDDTPGPITVLVSGERRRIQFVECPNNVNGMIDAAKYADAVIFVIDVSYGYEMETLEFVSLLKVHGMPRVIGVFTHLDCFEHVEENSDEIRTFHFKKNFGNEICGAAHTFCLSAPVEEMYLEHDICKLASFISGMEFHPLPWRAAHPYVLVDRFEDVTPTERLHMDANCVRDVILYGYLRGTGIKKKGTKVHIAGVGDFPLAAVTSLAEPCPLPHTDVTDSKMQQIDIIEHDEGTHFKQEVIRIGSYIMFKVCNVPSVIVNNRDPCQPILVGGISPREQTVGCISARFERHGMHMKALKTKDPIIVSVGWRRYLTTPVYALEDLSAFLEFTPEDKPCSAMFWGPFATPGTGVVAVQSLADNKAAFRILATGEVLGYSRAPYISLKAATGKINNDETSAEVPCCFNPTTAALGQNNRVWTADTKESEKSDAHVVWVSRERMKAPEGLRETLSELQEKKLKFPSQRRKTIEQRRAVIILNHLCFANDAKLHEAYLKQKEEDIRNGRPRGVVSTFLRKRKGT